MKLILLFCCIVWGGIICATFSATSDSVPIASYIHSFPDTYVKIKKQPQDGGRLILDYDIFPPITIPL